MITPDDLIRSPEWLPLELGPGNEVKLVRLDEAAYRAASFLDQRLLAGTTARAQCDLTLLSAAAARLVPRAHYLFHVGHVGSTLLSRLIGEHESFFSVREPAPLRALASGDERIALAPALALLARTWRPGERAVIKATSIVNEIAARILRASAAPVALLMTVAPHIYLRTILGGPNSRVEARTLAPLRWSRLLKRQPAGRAPAAPRSEGEWLAASWLAEMTCLNEAAVEGGCPVLWVDFDALLADPAAALAQALRTLGAAVSEREAEQIATGPLMRRYSKAPEHAYDGALRREVLASAEAEHRAEIKHGMAWLERAAARERHIATLLEFTASRGG